jgi:hypothetical protein
LYFKFCEWRLDTLLIKVKKPIVWRLLSKVFLQMVFATADLLGEEGVDPVTTTSEMGDAILVALDSTL